MEKKKIIKFVPYILLSVLVGVTAAYAGNLTPPESVGKSMYTLEDIYNLGAGTVIRERTGDIETTPPLSSSLKSLKSAYEKISTERGELSNGKIANRVEAFGFTGSLFGDTDATKVLTTATYPGTAILSIGDAVEANVIAGKYFSNTSASNVLGTMVDNRAVIITPSAASQSIPAGYHNGSGTVETDANLITGNIKNGISIFGVSGKTSVVDTISATASAGDILSGKTAYANGVPLTGTYTAPTDGNLVSWNIKSGTSIFGVAGSLLTNPLYGDDNPSKVLNTAANPGTYDPNTCTTAYNTLNLSAGTVKSGITYGNSETGSYPSNLNPLPGDTATADATSGNILFGFESWAKSGALITGSMSAQILSNLSNTISAGYYDSTTLSAVDNDLLDTNIKKGVSIFGITGTLSAYSMPKTGQTTSYTANDDGAYQKGFTGTRFLDNGDSTITDNATGLMWMKCSVGQSGVGCATGGYSTPSWDGAIVACEASTIGTHTDWRLPNIFELYSLLNFESGSSSWIDNSNFPLTKTTAQYRTSTTDKDSTTSAMGVSFATSGVMVVAKSTTGTYPFRCVR